MRPEDLSLLDQLEEWIESQIPRDLHDLPYRMLDTMERVSNEICMSLSRVVIFEAHISPVETLNLRGPDSISIPFPPFGGKEIAPPPPPPSAGLSALPLTIYNQAHRLVKAHPYVVGTGAAMALTVGLGYGAAQLGYGGRYGRAMRNRRKFGTRGVVEDGMLKEAIGESSDMFLRVGHLTDPSSHPLTLSDATVALGSHGHFAQSGIHRSCGGASSGRCGIVGEKNGSLGREDWPTGADL